MPHPRSPLWILLVAAGALALASGPACCQLSAYTENTRNDVYTSLGGGATVLWAGDQLSGLGAPTTSSAPYAPVAGGVQLMAPGAPGYAMTTTNQSYSMLIGGTTIWDGMQGTYDNEQADIPIGFTFPYYGTNHTTLRVSTNGYVTFPNENGMVAINTTIPNPSLPNAVIAPWWDDLLIADLTIFAAPDLVSYSLTGSAPNRTLIVEYKSVSRAGENSANLSRADFQVWLQETGVIEFHYGTTGISNGSPADASASVGMEDATGSSGLVGVLATPSAGRADFPPSGTVLRFTPTLPVLDDTQAALSVPFPWTYYGTPVTDLVVSSNGYVTVQGQSGTEPANAAIPGAGAPNPVIAPWWDDLIVADYGGGNSGIVRYGVSGPPGSQQLLIEWSRVGRQGDAPGDRYELSFQVLIDEATQALEFHYGPSLVVGSPASAMSATAGVENNQGNAGHEALPGTPSPGHPLADFPLSGTVVRFDPAFAIYDEEWATVPLGFSFVYDGVTRTTVDVHVNGYLGFGGGASVFQNLAIPDPAAPNPVLAPWWDDLLVADLGTTDKVLYETAGTPGSRTFTVEWFSVSRFGDTASDYNYAYFQVKLLEGVNQVELWYDLAGVGGSPTDFSASCGIEDNGGLFGFAPVAGSPSLGRLDFPAAGTVYEFTPPASGLVCGDCTGNATVDILDALTAAQHGASIITLVDPEFAACNVNGVLGGQGTAGASVDVLDALFIAQFAAAIAPGLSCLP